MVHNLDWLFIPTFLVFCIVATFMTVFVFQNSLNITFQWINVFIEGGTCISYLAVALSNPGIVFPPNRHQYENINIESERFCKKCDIRVPKKSYHCR